jgi:LEA14-like dessication related protein
MFAALVCASAGAVGCHAARPPELTVIGSSAADTHAEVVFVQVTNPASRPMRLTKLEYTFAADGGATVSQGELALARDVPAGAAVVVEVPMDAEASGAVTLTGTLTAQLDEIVQRFQLSAKIAAAAN